LISCSDVAVTTLPVCVVKVTAGFPVPTPVAPYCPNKLVGVPAGPTGCPPDVGAWLAAAGVSSCGAR
jgi:hypothetical protein